MIQQCSIECVYDGSGFFFFFDEQIWYILFFHAGVIEINENSELYK